MLFLYATLLAPPATHFRNQRSDRPGRQCFDNDFVLSPRPLCVHAVCGMPAHSKLRSSTGACRTTCGCRL
jgi:hypothetical protein